MPRESVRARCNDPTTAFGLKPDYGGEERIDDHCPGLQRAAESKCEQRCSTKRSRRVENCAESPHGQGGDSQSHKEQETGREAQSVIDACASQLADCARITLVLYRRRALTRSVGRDGTLGRAFDKAVRRKPLAFAADAGRYGNSINFCLKSLARRGL
jgi:hypothetical protein